MFGITRAPDFDRPGLTWFNVDGPLTLADLQGRLVVLDFWTFCCINCFHVLPTLRRIEDAFPGEVAVIGIHSPKFEHERTPAAVAAAIARYDIRHPVAHDPAMSLWRDYAIRAWPTLVLLSPDGHIIGQLSGEPDPDLLIQGLGDMIGQFFARGEIQSNPLRMEPSRVTAGALRFPGKIKPCPLADGAKGWAIADSGHHQIVIMDDQGQEMNRYGDGQPGLRDGGAEAMFNGPEGLACDRHFIYVADTRNHALRRIHRQSGLVETLAGNGWRGAILDRPEAAADAVLASPWDVEIVGNNVYFANAGSHQIGVYDPANNSIRAIAGNGGENIRDGRGNAALLAQPSGLARDDTGTVLFFADSETSAIRRLDLVTHHVETLAGTGLFEFGHVNGPLEHARLQHPLAVVPVDGRLYVADSYNSVIRVIDPAAATITDLAPPDCADTLCCPLSEPAGIAADGPNRLLISDTNNHRIVEYRLDLGRTRTWYE